MTVKYKDSIDSDELAYLMDKALRSDAAELSTSASKLNEGLNCLSEAASILETINEKKAAEAITVLIEKIAGVK